MTSVPRGPRPASLARSSEITDRHPRFVFGRDFDADRVLGRDVRVPSDQEPPHCRVDDKGQFDSLVQVAASFLSDIEGEDASLQDLHAVGLCHSTRATQGNSAQPERVEVAGRERAQYGIASPWKPPDRLRIPGIDSQRRSHQGRHYAESRTGGKAKRTALGRSVDGLCVGIIRNR
jgi:hypothetical protein